MEQVLDIAVKVTGMTHLVETESGHHFADESGTARLRFGTVTALAWNGAVRCRLDAGSGFPWNLRAYVGNAHSRKLLV